MNTLLVDSGPEAMKSAPRAAWRRAMRGAKSVVLFCELSLVVELVSEFLNGPGYAKAHFLKLAGEIIVLISIPLTMRMVPNYFETTEARLSALGGSEDDLEKLRKSVGETAELFCWLIWFFIIVFVL